MYKLKEKKELLDQVVTGSKEIEIESFTRREDVNSIKEDTPAPITSKTNFLPSMSHELRTPMNAILGYAQLLKGAFQGKEEFSTYLDDVHEIESSARLLLALINDIIDISKIESGTVELYSEEFDLKNEIDSIILLAKPLADENNNKFEYQIDESIGKVKIDIAKFKQILLNFLSNSFKYTEEGLVQFRMEKTSLDGRDAIKIQVQDTGVGMSPEQLEKVFYPFDHADASMSRFYGGTGLGLSISKKFVEMMQGKIEVESKVDIGSTFTITLPVNLEEAVGEDCKVIENIHLREQTPTTPEQSFIILIIDKNKDSHQAIKESLENYDYTILSAYDSETALELVKECRPELILLDLELPEFSSWDVLTMLKDDPSLAEIPIITAAESGDEASTYSLDPASFLKKPIDRGALNQVLANYKCDNAPSIALVVEDKKKNQNLMKRMIADDTWSVEIAGNGKIALDSITKRIPTIIFLDLMMPEMDGFEFLEKVKLNKKWREIPIIVVTAKELTNEDKEKLNGNVDALLQKGSFGPDQLEEEILKVAKKKTITSGKDKNAA